MTATERRALAWPHGVVTVETVGGMIGPTLFVLPSGQQVAPFQIAPWAGEPGSEALPGILKRLRGEWPCVPFGSDADRASVGDWPPASATPTLDTSPHGYASNQSWDFLSEEQARIGLAIAYPETHPVRRLVRTVRPDPAAAALDFELRIEVRHDCLLPIGLHPTFRLPEQPGGARLEIAEGIRGRTFPVAVDESAIFEQDRLLAPWHDVPLRNGDRLDIRRLPLPQATEELVQLLDLPGTAALVNEVEG